MNLRIISYIVLGVSLAWGAFASSHSEAADEKADAQNKSEPNHKHAAGEKADHNHDAKGKAGDHGKDGTLGQNAGDHGKESVLTFKTDLAIWTAAVFITLLLILKKFAWGPIAEGLEKREHGIAEHIASAERLNEDAKKLLAEYDQKLAGVQFQVREILEEARRDAEHTQKEILEKARKESELEIARGKREIETAAAAALKELAESHAQLAVQLAGKIIHAQLNAGDHQKLIQEAVSKFPRTTAAERN